MMLLASEMVSVKLNLRLRGYTGSLPYGGLPSPFSKKLLQSHCLQRHIHEKLFLHEIRNHYFSYPKYSKQEVNQFCVVFANCMCYHTTNKTNHNSMRIILKERN